MPSRTKRINLAADKYLALVIQFPLRPLRTEDDLDRAIAVIDSLLDRDPLAPEEEDYLDVLSDLVERYESAEHPQGPVSDADMLRHLIEAKEVTQADVAQATGIAESTVSAVLSGKQKLSRSHVGRLARYFAVSPAVFSF
ncbi:MAG TPA: helix-turn-helix domain-containing protein [Gemmataceae bacterium]|nr:helix-turn-helix domain-containing protein [Gemmataceae bacterium]